MANNSFRVIGIKAVWPDLKEFPSDSPKHYEKVEEIQRALYEEKQWFYFYKGITIRDDNWTVEMTSAAKKDFSLYDTKDLKVSISAVVGKNGAGKSCLVQLLVRALNNLAATLLGEKNSFSAEKHLHFIDYVFADVCYQIGNVVYLLQTHGRHVTITLFKASTKHLFVFKPVKKYTILNQNKQSDADEVLKQHKECMMHLKNFFFTLVCNYSLYDFNYDDYLSEATPSKRLEKLGIKVKDDAPSDDSLWLKGVFHKNDGYQTPIVVHPMRERNGLNIVKENRIAKERLSSLLFYKDNTENYPLRTINGDLHVVALSIRPTKNRYYSEDVMLDVLGIRERQNVRKNIETVRNFILGFWDEKYTILQKGKGKTQRQDAYDYIIYKTLKIVKNYKKYSPVFRYLSREYIDYETFKEVIAPLGQDYSHITKKLIQTINYLTTDIYTSPENYYNLSQLDQRMEKQGIRVKIKGKTVLLKQNLLPPPIFETDLILNKGNNLGIIPFSSISSGERQIAYTISNLMYEMVNVDSQWNSQVDKGLSDVIRYRFMNIVLDEVELYFHPEMQRQFIGILMKTIKSVHYSNLRGVNFLIVTHSPFVLSDIPDSNVLCMGEEGKLATKTLAGNILEMLNSSFFMSNTIGDAIKEEVSAIVELYNKAVRERADVQLAANRSRIKYICENVGDDFLRHMISRMFEEIENTTKKN